MQQQVEQSRDTVLLLHSRVSQARANMDSMTRIIQVGESLSTLLVSPVVSLQHLLLVLQGWAELHLLQRSGESLLELGDVEQSYKHIREEGEELLRLTQVGTSLRGRGEEQELMPLLLCSQVNRSLYGVEDSSDSWNMYLDHLDDKVLDGLFQLVLRSLHFLLDHMDPRVHTSKQSSSTCKLVAVQ